MQAFSQTAIAPNGHIAPYASDEARWAAVQSRDRAADGVFYYSVRTTGVYCRPICPARTPKAENCIFYPSAAAAQEAGFRPCLRCRPESSPDLGAWRGTSATVSRLRAPRETGVLHSAVEADPGATNETPPCA